MNFLLILSFASVLEENGQLIAICMGVGILIGLIVVGIMAAQMKSVRSQALAMNYVRPGSTQLTHSRDIFLYSHVSRTPKPKNKPKR